MLLAGRSTPVLALVLIASLGACSGTDDAPADAGPSAQVDGAAGISDAAGGGGDAMPSAADAGGFALTSTAFEEGGDIPLVHTCDGDNISPALAWTSPPPGTMSYAIVFNDITFDFLHSVTWDIPASVTSIPADIDKSFEPADLPGAKQAPSYLGPPGYAGPCPPAEHTYEFRVHALGVATLPGVGAQTNRATARTAIEGASIGFATLQGNFQRSN